MVDPLLIVGTVIAFCAIVAVAALIVERHRGRGNGLLTRLGHLSDLNLEHWRDVHALRRRKGTPIEQIAADLRRLRDVIATDEHRSAARQMGDRLAYDNVLSQACAMLDIAHELDSAMSGMERDIERVRVEAELERAGVVLSDNRRGQAA